MTDKIVQGINHIKSVSKKKVTIDRIRAHLLKTDDGNNDNWSIEKLESMLTDLKVQSCKLYNNKYMIALTQITNTETLAFIAVLVFKL